MASSQSARWSAAIGGLDRALNQQAELVPPLRRARDFFAVPEQIRFFVAGETLAGQSFLAARRKLRFHLQFRKRQPQPVVDAPVAFLGLERMPFVAGRKNGAVSPVRVVRHNAAAGRTADERTQNAWRAPLRKISGNSRTSPPAPSSRRNAAPVCRGAAWLRATPRPAPC